LLSRQARDYFLHQS